jgi:hypothetical protein
VALREPEAPLFGLCIRVIDLEYAGHRLLFEPLPRVALVGARGIGELRSCGTVILHESLVEAQAIT